MLTLPFIVLLTFAALRLFGVPATVMSLGGIAIALGLAVDAEVVALEACTPPGSGAGSGPIRGAAWWSGGRAGAGHPDVAAHRGAGFVPVFALAARRRL